jgi:hypothetical protein
MSAHRQPPRPRPLLDEITLPWAVAIAAMIACIALGSWALVLRNDLDDAEGRIAALVQERDDIRRAATATVYELSPTGDGPAEASGTLYLTATGSGVLNAANLPDPGDSVYQLWFHPQDGGSPLPGPTFTLDEDGLGFALIAADTGAFGSVSISREPAGGSETPSGPIVLTGDAAGARG